MTVEREIQYGYPGVAARVGGRVLDLRDFRETGDPWPGRCTVNPDDAGDIDGFPYDRQLANALAALPKTAFSALGRAAGGGGPIHLPGTTLFESPITIPAGRAHVTLRGEMGNFRHPTESVPPGIVFAPAGGSGSGSGSGAGGHDFLVVNEQGFTLENVGVSMRSTGGAAVRSNVGQLSLTNVCLHNLDGNIDGPAAGDGFGLLCVGQQSNIHLWQVKTEGFEIAYDLQSVANFTLGRVCGFYNVEGVRLGWTGGTSGKIYAGSDFQDNSVCNIHAIRCVLLCCGNYFECGKDGVGLPSPDCYLIGDVAIPFGQTYPIITSLGNTCNGQGDAAGRYVNLHRCASLNIQHDTLIGFPGTLIHNTATQVAHVRIRGNELVGSPATIVDDYTGVVEEDVSDPGGAVRFRGGLDLTEAVGALAVAHGGGAGVTADENLNNWLPGPRAAGAALTDSGESAYWSAAPRNLAEHVADVGNGTTVETDLASDDIPAGTLVAPGDRVEALYVVNVVGHATATRQEKIKTAGTTILDTTALTYAANQAVTLRAEVVRSLGSTTARAVAGFEDGTARKPVETNLTGLDFTAAITTKITGQAGAAGAATNDIVLKLARLTYWPSGNSLYQGLREFWAFDEASGASRLGSRNGTTLTNHGTVGVGTDPWGTNAASFPSSLASYLSRASDAKTQLVAGRPWAISAWVKPNDVTGGRSILGKFGTPGEWLLCIESNKAKGYFTDAAGTTRTITGATTVSIVAWSWLLITYDVKSFRLYLNNALDAGPVAAGGGSHAGAAEFNVGCHGGGAAYAFDGLINDPAVWDRVPSAAERARHYAATAPLY